MLEERSESHRARPSIGSKSARKRQRYNVKTHGPPPPAQRPAPPPNPTITAPSDTTVARILRRFHRAPGCGRAFTPAVSAWPVNKSDIAGNPLVVSLSPPESATLGTLLYLAPTDTPASSRHAIQNYFLNGVYSTAPLDHIEFEMYWMLPPGQAERICRSALAAYLKDLKTHGFDVSLDGLEEAEILSSSIADNPTCPVGTEQLKSDSGSIAMIPEDLHTLPYRHVVRLPLTAPAQYGLQILSSRQHDWHPAAADYSSLGLRADYVAILKTQRPVLRLTSTLPAPTPADSAWIKSPSFKARTAEDCFRFFREAALFTYAMSVDNHTDMTQASRATQVTQLPPYTQQLLQSLNALQPTTDFQLVEGKEDQVSFSAVKNRYNPLQQQGQQFMFHLHHPNHPTSIPFIASAPRPSSEEKGDLIWHEYFKTALLIQSSTALPLETASHEEGRLPLDGYLYKTLLSRLEHALLSSDQDTTDMTDAALERALTLKAAPDASVVLSHAGTGKMATNVVVALEDPAMYSLLVTSDISASDVELNTKVQVENALHKQIVTLTIRPHFRSILGGKYNDLLTQPSTQQAVIDYDGGMHSMPTDLALLELNADKGTLKGPRALKISWSHAMIAHPLTLALDKLTDEKHKAQKAKALAGLVVSMESDE